MVLSHENRRKQKEKVGDLITLRKVYRKRTSPLFYDVSMLLLQDFRQEGVRLNEVAQRERSWRESQKRTNRLDYTVHLQLFLQS